MCCLQVPLRDEERCVIASDTSDRQPRSASLSSDDFTGHSQTPSRSSTLPYDHTPQRAQPQRGAGPRLRARTASPGSEMVTLEEFLHESNLQSPPVVRNDTPPTVKTSLVCERRIQSLHEKMKKITFM